MNFIKKIYLFFKNILRKEKNTLLLEAFKDNNQEEKKLKFFSELRIDSKNKKKKKVETLTCIGDGLGIQGKINY